MREFVTYEWFTILCTSCILLISVVKYLFSARFNDFIFVVGNSKYLKIHSKDLKFIDPFDSLLFINLILSLGVFIHLLYYTLVEPLEFDMGLFLKLCLAITSIFLIKILLERIIGSVFEIEPIMETYLFQKTSYKNFTGLILLIANLILLYGLKPSEIAIYAIIAAVFIINGIGFLTSFRNYQNILNRNFFYFLLYLCALEIGPYVILYKVVTEYNS